MVSIHTHIDTHIPAEMHISSAGEHPDSPHAAATPRPPLNSSSQGFPLAGASGQASGLLGHLGNTQPASGQTSVKLPGDANRYVIKDSSNTRTPQPLYVQSPENGRLKQTPKMGIHDGNGGVQLDRGLPGGGDNDPLLGGKPKSTGSSRGWSWGKGNEKQTGSGPSQSTIPYKPLAEKGTQDYQQQKWNVAKGNLKDANIL